MTDRDVVPRVVADLVRHEVPVFGAQAQPPTLEDVYFEIESRILAEEGTQTTDGFLGVDRTRNGAATMASDVAAEEVSS